MLFWWIGFYLCRTSSLLICYKVFIKQQYTNSYQYQQQTSQKIFGDFLFIAFGFIFCSLKDLIILCSILVDFQNGCNITTAIAIIWSRPNSDQFLCEHFLITFHYQLVGSADQRYVIGSIKLLHAALPEEITSTSRRNCPALYFIRIRPHQVAHRSIVWYLLSTIYCSDIVKIVSTWRQPSMNTEYFIVYYGCQRQKIEDLCAVFPNVQRSILPQALIIEPVDLSDLSRFVIASQKCDPGLVPNFQGEQQDKGLNTVQSSINKISQEQIGNVRCIPSYFKQFQQVIKLAMNIATYRDRRVYFGQIGLFAKDLFSLIAQEFDAGLFDKLIFSYL